MRIGIDMLGVQSPLSRGRGIGRYALSLVTSLVSIDNSHEYIFYSHDSLDTDIFPSASNAIVRSLSRRESSAEAIDEVARTNPDQLDALLLLSPFELHDRYAPPAKPLNRLAMFAVVYDLIPFLFQERYLTWPPIALAFYRNLERLRQYDALLAISDATRDDCLRLLGLSGERVVSIRGASDAAFFTPEPEASAKTVARDVLERLGITQPFVFCLGSMDERKNLWGLIDAFRLLPSRIRNAHQLVITFAIKEEEERKIRAYAADRGVADRLVLTGGVSDDVLRWLYRRCAAFAFPSLYEGLGLPLLEAMHCGAVVLGGNNSSQPEVVGDAGLLANASDIADISEKLARLIEDDTLRTALREKGFAQASRFTWEDTAQRTLVTLERIAGERPQRRKSWRLDAGHPDRPRLAVFSPWPPKRSGISDYSERLVTELARWYSIDLYHDPGYVPNLAIDSDRFGCFDARVFPRNARIRGYRGILYQMGNSHYHRSVYENLLEFPGVVTLHDYCLSGFHAWYSRLPDVPRGHFEREVEYGYPDQADQILASLKRWSLEPGGIGEACARREIHLNRRVFKHAKGLIVHSLAVQERASRDHPEYVSKVTVIPHGSEPKAILATRRATVRERFGLPTDALILASFGILHATKMNVETVEAFAHVIRSHPELLLLFVGEDLTFSAVRNRVFELGLADRVRFLGRQSAADFEDLLEVADIGICLRRPPTNGETSGALLHLLRHGIPTIVNDVGTFSDYSDDVVFKLNWESDGIVGLARAIQTLVNDPDARRDRGRAARRYVQTHHDWPIVADLYAQVIEQFSSLPSRSEGRAIAPIGRRSSRT